MCRPVPPIFTFTAYLVRQNILVRMRIRETRTYSDDALSYTRQKAQRHEVPCLNACVTLEESAGLDVQRKDNGLKHDEGDAYTNQRLSVVLREVTWRKWCHVVLACQSMCRDDM